MKVLDVRNKLSTSFTLNELKELSDQEFNPVEGRLEISAIIMTARQRNRYSFLIPLFFRGVPVVVEEKKREMTEVKRK